MKQTQAVKDLSETPGFFDLKRDGSYYQMNPGVEVLVNFVGVVPPIALCFGSAIMTRSPAAVALTGLFMGVAIDATSAFTKHVYLGWQNKDMDVETRARPRAKAALRSVIFNEEGKLKKLRAVTLVGLPLLLGVGMHYLNQEVDKGAREQTELAARPQLAPNAPVTISAREKYCGEYTGYVPTENGRAVNCALKPR